MNVECGRFLWGKDLNGSNALTTARDHNSLGGGFEYFSFSLWRNDLIWLIYTNILQMGWFNHQHVVYSLVYCVELTNTLELTIFLCPRFS